ncbi:YbaK/EbsC family protein [haloarchaeon 3A1-DGR]|nr:YbaK/EbsC family protein [haloarchaeon 3A1-DGR]
MHPRASEFAERAAAEHDLEVAPTEFPEGTKTAADAADAIGCATAQIASSIVVRIEAATPDHGTSASPADEDLVVAVTSGANRVDLAAVADRFDAADAAMADADRVREIVGWSIGGVPPICHDADLPVVLDPTLREFDVVWAAAGTPTAVWPVDPERLVAVSGATVVDLTE